MVKKSFGSFAAPSAENKDAVKARIQSQNPGSTVTFLSGPHTSIAIDPKRTGIIGEYTYNRADVEQSNATVAIIDGVGVQITPN